MIAIMAGFVRKVFLGILDWKYKRIYFYICTHSHSYTLYTHTDTHTHRDTQTYTGHRHIHACTLTWIQTDRHTHTHTDTQLRRHVLSSTHCQTLEDMCSFLPFVLFLLWTVSVYETL